VYSLGEAAWRAAGRNVASRYAARSSSPLALLPGDTEITSVAVAAAVAAVLMMMMMAIVGGGNLSTSAAGASPALMRINEESNDNQAKRKKTTRWRLAGAVIAFYSVCWA